MTVSDEGGVRDWSRRTKGAGLHLIRLAMMV